MKRKQLFYSALLVFTSSFTKTAAQTATFQPSPGYQYRISNLNGTLDIGPQNSSWHHIISDPGNTTPRPFYMNAPLHLAGSSTYGGILSSYNGTNLNLAIGSGTGFNIKMIILASNGNVGIGTTQPDYKLEIRGNLELENNDADNQLRFHDPGDYYYSMGIDRSDAGKFKINFGGNIGDAEHFTMLTNGNIGIGLAAAPSRLSVLGGYSKTSGFSINNGDVHTTIFNQSNTNSGIIQVYSGGNAGTIGGTPYHLQLQPEGGNVGIGLNSANASAKLHVNGNVLIGNDPPPSPYNTYELAVDGNIVAKAISVTIINWPDYVFKKGYYLRSLKEVDNYLKANCHLPEVPSAKEVEKNGISLGEMQVKHLQKTEEIFLYLIELNTKIEQLQKRNEEMALCIVEQNKKIEKMGKKIIGNKSYN